MNPEGAVARLAKQTGVEFPNLAAARVYSAEQLDDARQKLTGAAPRDVSVVLFGSGARGELTSGSDNDWAILTPTGRDEDDDVVELAAQCREIFNDGGKAPGRQAVFGVPFAWPALPENIGLDEDLNTNLTRRMLTLLESVAVTGDAREKCWDAILKRYLRHGVKDHRPPRFLLNDTIRYWRTICVDFEGKRKDSGGNDPKWVTRNAKLRTSRKLLFASGLLPVLFCRLRELAEIPDFLEAQFRAPATDRVAWAFLELDLVDEGARCLGAYDEWVGLLGDEGFRSALAALHDNTRDASPDFARVRDIGKRLDGALLALLFNSRLGSDAQRFLVL